MGVGITGQIFNKSRITKGCQTVLVRDVHHIRPHAYRHRHKFHLNNPRWNAWDKIEVKKIMEVMKLMAEEEERDERKIFCEHPHSTRDNYFSGYQIMNWLNGNGFGDTMTCRRDRFPGETPGQYLHKTKQTLLIEKM